MKYLITGITGSLGTAVSRSLLDSGNEVIGISRDECKQARIPRHSKLTLYLCDIRDQDRFVEASRGVDLIYHFAALKHVDILEDNPEEAIETNVAGTKNVLHAQRVNKVPRVVLSSTDKAAYPINTYGMSKGLAERLVLRNPSNIVCRYGNVLASRGSVVEKFVRTLRDANTVELTDANMSRFWITIKGAAEFVIWSSRDTKGGLKIPQMKAASVSMVAEVIAKIMKIPSYKVVDVGIRKGEKIAECLRTSFEGQEAFSNSVTQYTEEELTNLLLPIVGTLCQTIQ